MAKQKTSTKIGKYFVIAIIVALTLYFITLRPETDLEIIPTTPGPDLTTQQDLNLSLYAGTWYEIARSPNNFEEDCECATAQYENNKENVGILNTCYRKGLTDEIRGTGTLTQDPGTLKIQFFPFTSSQYKVLWVDESYRNALVYGEGDYWILGREGVSEEEISNTISIAEERGLDTSILIRNERCYE